MVRVSSDQSIRTEGRPSKLGFLAMLFTPPPNNPKNYENRVVRVKEILFPCLSERWTYTKLEEKLTDRS